jgi:hypothetical protein
LGALLCAPMVLWLAAPARADEPIAFKGPVILDTGVTVEGKVLVDADHPLPVTCPDGSCSGSGGGAGGSTVTLAAAATGGCTPGGFASAASANATSIKTSAGTLCGGMVINTTATVYYLRLYNLATTPNCASATGFVTSVPVPASTTGAGTLLNFGPFGAAFTAGIGACLTGGGSGADNSNAAAGVFVTYAYK